jgi:hypothetical protein
MDGSNGEYRVGYRAGRNDGAEERTEHYEDMIDRIMREERKLVGWAALIGLAVGAVGGYALGVAS